MWKVAFEKSQKCWSQFRQSNTGQLPWKNISQFMNTKERHFYLGNLILSHLQISIIFQQKGVNLQNIHIKFWLTNRATTKVKIPKSKITKNINLNLGNLIWILVDLGALAYFPVEEIGWKSNWREKVTRTKSFKLNSVFKTSTNLMDCFDTHFPAIFPQLVIILPKQLKHIFTFALLTFSPNHPHYQLDYSMSKTKM